VSRLEKMRADGVHTVPLPPMDPACEYLLGHFLEVGPAQAGGMGLAPVGYTELAAWQQLSGVPLQPWEARLLRHLSREYVAEHHAASEQGRPAPWAAPGSTDQRAAVSRQLSLNLRAMAMAQRQKATQ
jgi:hypothetical protein